MKHCAICNEPINSGVVCHQECVELLDKALDVAARYCSYDGECPACNISNHTLDWSDCSDCTTRVGINAYNADREQDRIQRAACWKRFFMEHASTRHCRVCGCTEALGCIDGCYWVEDDLCSQCAEKIQDSDQYKGASG